jgi:hypothetical protein
VVSAAAELRLLSVKQPINGQVELRWGAEPGAIYEVVCKDQLNDPTWTRLGQVTNTSNAAAFTDSLGTNRQRFYQIKPAR